MKTIYTLFIFCWATICVKAQSSEYMLDYSFGYKGRVTTTDSLSYYKFGSETRSVLVQKDGKIIVAGSSFACYGSDFLLIRYFPNGKIDSSFGENGLVHYGHRNDPCFLDYLTAAKLQSDGKIVVSAYTFQSHSLLRFLPNGKIDSRFGDSGRVQLFQKPFSIDIDEKDNIIACESYNNKNDLLVTLQHFNKNGKPDLSFGVNNLVTKIIGEQTILGYDLAKVKFDRTGKIVVGVTWYPNNNDDKSKMVILRFYSNGKTDNRFNNTGRLIIDNADSTITFGDIGFLSNNKIIIGSTIRQNTYSQGDFLIICLNKNGVVDSSFGINGLVTTDFSTTLPLKSDGLSTLCIQEDNKIVAAGNSQRKANNFIPNHFFSLCRYNPNGSLDTSFGNAGLIKTGFGDDNNCAAGDATIQPDGKIILAGFHSTVETGNSSGEGDIAIARYNKERNNFQQLNILNIIVKRNNSASIYPNPAHNILNITNLDATMLYEVKIINNYGSIITSTNINKTTSYNFNVENLSNGVYYISIISNQSTITKKFIKE